MNVVEELRKEYETRGLGRLDLDPDPMNQFDRWFQEAVEKSPGRWIEANAMTLSTCIGDFVTSRTVLLKEHENRRFVFFTNYGSEKGRQLQQNPAASMLFHWPYLGRQIRINGRVEKTSREHSEKYFHSRSRGSQLSAYASSQSSEVASREQLEKQRQDIDERFANQPVPLPENWGGFALRPCRFEFWQGRLDRLHDRFQYTCELDENLEWQQWPEWKILRLNP